MGKSADAPGQLNGSSVALGGDTEADALITPFMNGEMAAPGTYCDTLPQVPQQALALSQPGVWFY